MLGNDENRNFMRMSVNADAKIVAGSGQHEQIIDAVCLDLSATGASLQIQQPLTESQQVVIYVKSGGQVPPLKALAEVVRSQRLDNGDHQVGCHITKML
ncbi:MAG: PilZ domain-containing protein [Pseudomonadota bacterium]